MKTSADTSAIKPIRFFYALSKVPLSLRSAFAKMAGSMPSFLQKNHFLRRLCRAGSILNSSPHEFNFKLFCYFDQNSQKELLAEPLAQLDVQVYDYFFSLYGESDSEEFIDQILTCDSYGYLPDCLLVKMDIASMSNSLEARSPFLDHELIEFAARIPSRYKVKYNGGKWILKKALKGFLPEPILNRRKMGFGVPLSKWFKGPLKDYLRDVLFAKEARQRGYFKMEEVERLVNEHQNNQRDHGYKLWALLMFELWNKVYMDGSYHFGGKDIQ